MVQAVGGGIDHLGTLVASVVDSPFDHNNAYVDSVSGTAISTTGGAGSSAFVDQTTEAYGGGLYTLADTLQIGKAYPFDGSATPLGFGSAFTNNNAYIRTATGTVPVGLGAADADVTQGTYAIGGGVDHQGTNKAYVIASPFYNNDAYVGTVIGSAASVPSTGYTATVDQTTKAYGGGLYTQADTLQVGKAYYDGSSNPTLGFGSKFQDNNAFITSVVGTVPGPGASEAEITQGTYAIGGGIDHRGTTVANIIGSPFYLNDASVGTVSATALSVPGTGYTGTISQTTKAYGGGVYTQADMLQIGKAYYDGSSNPTLGFGSKFQDNNAFITSVMGTVPGPGAYTATVTQTTTARGGGVDHQGTNKAYVIASPFYNNDAYVGTVIGSAASVPSTGYTATVDQTTKAYGGGLYTQADTLQVGKAYYDGSSNPTLGFGSKFQDNNAFITSVVGTVPGPGASEAEITQGTYAIGGGIDHRGTTVANIIGSPFYLNDASVGTVSATALSVPGTGYTGTISQTTKAYGGGVYTQADMLQIGKAYYDGSSNPTLGFGSKFQDNNAFITSVMGTVPGPGAYTATVTQTTTARGGGVDHQGTNKAYVIASPFYNNDAYVGTVIGSAASVPSTGYTATVDQTTKAYGGGLYTQADTLQVGKAYYDGSSNPTLGFGSKFQDNNAFITSVVGTVPGPGASEAEITQGTYAIGGGIDHRGTTVANIIGSPFYLNDASVGTVSATALSVPGTGYTGTISQTTKAYGGGVYTQADMLQIGKAYYDGSSNPTLGFGSKFQDNNAFITSVMGTVPGPGAYTATVTQTTTRAVAAWTIRGRTRRT